MTRARLVFVARSGVGRGAVAVRPCLSCIRSPVARMLFYVLVSLFRSFGFDKSFFLGILSSLLILCARDLGFEIHYWFEIWEAVSENGA